MLNFVHVGVLLVMQYHAISAEETALKTIKLAVQEIWFTKSYTAVQSDSSVPFWVMIMGSNFDALRD